MQQVTQVRRFGALAALAILVAATGWVIAARVQVSAASTGQTATMKPVAPVTAIKKGDVRVPIDITVDGAENMASFQFILQYNADIFDAADTSGGPVIQKGDFLGSTGREVVCADPVVEPGAVRFTCVTLRPTPAGPDGAGKIATVYLKAIGSGKTDLTLDRVKANHADNDASDMPITAENAPVEVEGDGGMNWLLWGSIIAVAVIVVLGAAGFGAMRARSSSTGAAPAA